ncbi:unnamed protein product [Rhizoctonia solani]|uniref:Uncharacterized protein n=1 Tax=Rhizoctonia solani TaxID=456999 RepID=A0A8H3B481_9AGAM|nr:unnamed protein product [Rhizoctonia solani]
MTKARIQQRVTLSTDTHASLESIRKISLLGSEGDASAIRDLAKSIDVSTVNSALRLSLDSITVSHLTKDGPAVIKGCIRVMKVVATENSKHTPSLNHECVYVCFRLLVITLNLCTLKRCGKLGKVLTTYTIRPDANIHAAISVALSGVIKNHVNPFAKGLESDSIDVFGWSFSSGLDRQTPLVTPTDVLMLLKLLWDLRKSYLQAMLSTSPPALSGLLFLFVRSLSQQHSPIVPDRELLKCKLYELGLRYLLIGEEDRNQHEVVGDILGRVSPDDHLWRQSSKYVDAEDSRCILKAYIDLIYKTKHNRTEFTMENLYFLLCFIVLSVESHAQGLLSSVIRSTLDYTWDLVLSLEGQKGIGPAVSIGGIFRSLTIILDPTNDRPYRLTRSTLKDVMEVMHQQDLVNLVAVVITKLKPGPSWPLSEDSTSTLQSLMAFFYSLSKVFPADQLKECFQDYVLDWWKFTQYIHITTYGFMVSHAGMNAYRDHYGRCNEVCIALCACVATADARQKFHTTIFTKGANAGVQTVMGIGGIAMIVVKQSIGRSIGSTENCAVIQASTLP